MFRIVIKKALQTTKNANSQRLFSSSLSADVLQNYGQHVPVSIPLIKDVIPYPNPVLHKDHAKVRRLTHDWALQFWDSQLLVDYMLASDWPYMTGYLGAHLSVDHYLIFAKFAVWVISFDCKMYDYSEAERKRAYNNLSKVLFKFFLNFAKKNGKNIEAYTNDLASMDGTQKMLIDLLLSLGNQKYLWPILKKCPDWFIGYLKHDLKKKKDETFVTSFDDFVNVRSLTFGSEAIFRSLMFIESRDINKDEQLMKVPDFKRLLYMFELITGLPNDIRSFNKEQLDNDHWGNGVTVLAREKGVSLQEGVEIAIRMLDDAITEFQNISWRLRNSDLNQQFPYLKQLVEVAIPNFAYGSIKYCDINGVYKTGDAKTFVDPNPNIGYQIDPALVFSRVKKD